MAKEKTIILVVLTSLVVGFLIGVFLWSGDKPTTPPQVENFNPAGVSGTSEQRIEEQPSFEAASGENPSSQEGQSTPQPNSSASQVSPPAPSSQ